MRAANAARLAQAVICAAFAMAVVTPSVRAAAGSVLVEYLSALGTTPELQGWEHEGRCLGTSDNEPLERCPKVVGDPNCWFQGAQDFNFNGIPDNNCLPGIGCRRSYEHYNSPIAPTSDDRCMYTEWILFDNGDNDGLRPMTISDATIPGSPPWGAPFFSKAPSHSPLRISTGDGNYMADTLPVSGADAWRNTRNLGKTKIRRGAGHGTPYTVEAQTATTLLCKIAAGPRGADHPFVLVRQSGHEFRFGVDGDAQSATFGQIVYENTADDIVPLFGGRTVVVAVPGTAGPHVGEFFIFRAVLRPDGTFDAWLNDRLSTLSTGTFACADGETEIQITPEVGDDTLWVDYVQLLEGEMPAECPEPRPDVNRDGKVNMLDWANAEGTGFQNCATGPAAEYSTWEALSADCKCLDINGDADIDMADYAVFQRCHSGTSPADPTCDD